MHVATACMHTAQKCCNDTDCTNLPSLNWGRPVQPEVRVAVVVEEYL